MRPLRRLAVPVLAALAAAGWAADPIRMDVRATFSGPLEDTSVVTVVLENDGPDARGVLQVSSDGGPVAYPVELPQGARKRLLTFPTVGWGDIGFSLETNRGAVARKLPAVHPSFDARTGGQIALIGDDGSGLAFLRRQSDGKRVLTIRDAYVKPEEAPGRPVAYRAFSSVVIGPGAERMGDDAVAALKDYALGGGTLVFLGGASAPVLEDARWAEVLPGRGWKPRTLTRGFGLSKLGGAPVPGAFTILTPTQIAKGAKVRTDEGALLETERGYGLGSVVVLGYSPLEAPLSAWAGRTKAMSRFARGGGYGRAFGFTQAYLQTSAQEYGGGVTYAMPAATAGGPGTPIAAYAPGAPVPGSVYGPGATGDPFSTKLPDTSTVFGILAVYFVLVVPVSFLVLRKMKRGELAWVTAPVLALGFAGALFKSAESLYSAALSSASQGVVVLQQGAPNALFYGTSQLFFPRGGSYDLKLENVDSLAGVQTENYYGYRNGSDALEGFNLVDTGTMKAPALEANNLAFRELSYVQRVPEAEWFGMERVGKDRLKVTNRSPYLFSGRVVSGPTLGKDFAVAAGGSAIVPMGQGETVPAGTALSPVDARNFTRNTGRIALWGRLEGFRPGPQIGKEVTGRSGINVIAFAQETMQ